MTNGEKFEDVFGFGADGSRIIAVNATWWDCKYQSHKRSNEVKPVVRGKWEHFGSDVFRCSECGYGIQPWNIGVNFCPSCGADMREES